MAAFVLAWSPWAVAWSREARFYVFQQTVYLLTMGTAWRLLVSETRGGMLRWAGALLALFVAGLFACFHSVVFAGTVGRFRVLSSGASRNPSGGGRGRYAPRLWRRG